MSVLEKQSIAREFTASHCCEFSIVSDSERITYPYGKDEYEYNTQKQVVKQKRSIDGYGEREVSYTYTKAGLPDTVTYPDGNVVTYGYTRNGKFSTMNYAGTEFASGTKYNNYGAVSSLNLDNGLINTMVYDKLIRCTELSHVKKVEGGTETGFSLTYEYDACGNITTKTDSTGVLTESYTYDGRNRLKSSTSTSLGSHEWTYDDFNNIVSWTRTVGNTPKVSSYTYEGLVNGSYEGTTTAGKEGALTAAGSRHGPHAVTAIETGGKTAEYVYNANGDMTGSLTGEGIGRIYSYDSQNRMTGMTVSNGADTNRWTYAYDDGGERIIKNTIAAGEGGKVVASTVYWFTGYEETYENVITAAGDILAPNGQRLASRVSYLSSADGTTVQKTEILPRSEINGEQGVVRQAVIASIAYLYQIKDLLGSTVRVYNEKGECIETLGYEPFGKLVMKNGERIDKEPGTGDSGLTGAKRTYTGHMLETDDGLYYCHARWYDAGAGRFIQADSVLDGLNRYTYCGNNPVNFSDPSGTKKDGESGEKKSLGQRIGGAIKSAAGKVKGFFSGKRGEANGGAGHGAEPEVVTETPTKKAEDSVWNNYNGCGCPYEYTEGNALNSSVPKIVLNGCRDDFADTMKLQVGGKYVWGGSDPSTGTDCSGGIYDGINKQGNDLDRGTSRDLYDITTPVADGDLKRGDLRFLKDSKGIIFHVQTIIDTDGTRVNATGDKNNDSMHPGTIDLLPGPCPASGEIRRLPFEY